jgi:hypothetical protein
MVYSANPSELPESRKYRLKEVEDLLSDSNFSTKDTLAMSSSGLTRSEGRKPMRRESVGFASFILSAIAVALPFPTYADPIPAAEITISAAGATTIETAGTRTGSGCNGGAEGGCQNSTMTVSYANGNASASGSGFTSGGVATANATGAGDVTFFFSVVGSGSELVPLLFTASGSTSASGPDTEAQAYFETPGGDLYACSATGSAVGACGTEPSSFSGSLMYNATPGDLYDLSIMTLGAASLGTGSWSTSLDPQMMVEINPSFADAGDFTLEFSPNVAVTTEPSSLYLLATGLLALVGTVKYRT